MAGRNGPLGTSTQGQPIHDLTRAEEPEREGTPCKRRRIAVACKSCRSRKSRCNGNQPSCSLCSDLGLACVYELPRNPSRTNQKNDYDERLNVIEDALQELLQRTSWDSTRSPISSDTAAAAAGQRGTQSGASQTTEVGHSVGSGLQHVEDSSVDGMAAVTAPVGTEIGFFGPSSNIAFMQGVSRAASCILKAPSVSDQSVNRTYPLVSRAQSPRTFSPPSAVSNPQPANPSIVPNATHGLGLLKLYFSDTGLMYPFIGRREVIDAYETFSRNQFAAVPSSWLCLFNAIFAFATYISANPQSSTTANMKHADVFFNRALVLVSQAGLRFPNMPSVQSLLLLAQYCQGTQRADEGWMLHGLATRAAIQLGLHCPPKEVLEMDGPLNMKRRTWLACLTLDRTLSMTFGRPLNIPEGSDDIPSEQDLMAAADNTAMRSATVEGISPPLPDTSCFLTTTARLYQILANILRQIYLDNSSHAIQTTSRMLLQKIIGIEEDLARWKTTIPPKLALQPWLEPCPRTPAQQNDQHIFWRLSVVTQLRFLNTRLLLHRVVLDNALKRVVSGDEGHLPPICDVLLDNFTISSLHICQDCAMEIITIVSTMSSTKALLGAWWFSIYYTFNASLVIFGSLLLALSRVRQSWITPLHREAMSAIRLAKLADHLRQAVSTIDHFGNDTELVKRILRVMIKSVKVCTILAQTEDPIDLVIINALRNTGNGRVFGCSNVGEHAETMDSGLIGSGMPMNLPQDFGPGMHEDIFSFFAETDGDIFGNQEDDGFLNLLAI